MVYGYNGCEQLSINDHIVLKNVLLHGPSINVSFILYFYFTLIEFLFIIFNVCLASVDLYIKYIVHKELEH